jgi:hypothetical protein
MNNYNGSSHSLKPHSGKSVEEIVKPNTAMKTMNCTIDRFDFREVNVRTSALQRFGTLIRYRRKKSGYTTLAFATKTGLDLETLLAVEFGFASLEDVRLNLGRIASGLDFQPGALRRILNEIYTDHEDAV